MSTHEPSDGRVGSPDPALVRAWEDLTLDELRVYRRRLAHEEERVSYWRRLLHARIDVLEAQAHQERALTTEELVRVLGDTGTGRGRTALVSVHAADPLPEPRRAVAENPRAHRAVLARLASDPDDDIRARARARINLARIPGRPS